MSKTIFDTLCVVEFTPGVSIDLVNHVYKRIQSPKLRPKINDSMMKRRIDVVFTRVTITDIVLNSR